MGLASSHEDREALARELYRRLYPGAINKNDSIRTPETDLAEEDRAYATWDLGGGGWAPRQRCYSLADALLAIGFHR